jgi:hypothetical protein
MDEEEEPLTKQLLNMLVDNNDLRQTASPYITAYLIFNLIILILLIYISVRISLR